MFKKAWIAALAALAIGLSGYVTEVDAKRMGGGRSVGQQNSMTRQAPPPQAAPGAPASAQQSAAARQNAAAAGQAQSRSRWMAPLAGLAAGLGLAALASWMGFGEEFATFMLIMLLMMVALIAFRFFMARRRAAQGGAQGGRGGLAYQGAHGGAGPAGMQRSADPRAQWPGAAARGATGAAAGAAAGAAGQQAVGFDVDQFVRAARGQFTRLQGAFDTGRVEELREFTSPSMYDELQRELADRGGRAQQTEILTLNADFLGTEHVGTGGRDELAAVRFTGLVREAADQPAQPIDEVWNFSRPRDGSSGWVLAGIQQQDGAA